MDYWSKRAEEILLSSEKSSEEIIIELLKIYDITVAEINSKMKRIFQNYKLREGLTQEEAIENLTYAQQKEHIQEIEDRVLRALNTKEQQEAIALYNARSADFRISRLNALKDSITLKLNTMASLEELITTKHYKEVIRDVTGKVIKTYTPSKQLPTAFNSINQYVSEAVLNKKWFGSNFSDRIWNNKDLLEKKLNEDLKSGLLQGDSVHVIARKFSKEFNTSMYNATRLVRTETNYFNNQVTLHTLKDSGYDEYRIVATLDKRTSKICRSKDGQIHKIDKARVGLNCPPFHPNCRTTISGTGKVNKRIARDYMTGENYETESLTYEEYEKEQEDKHDIDAEIERKKHINLKKDKEQHRNYLKFYGDKIPKTFDKFQDFKYNDYRYNRFKNYYVMSRREMLPSDLTFEIYEKNLNAKGFDGWTAVGFNPQRKKTHLKHLEDFNLDKSKPEDWIKYETKAKELLNNAKKHEHFIDEKNNMFVYDKNKNNFAVAYKNGIIQTLFKPTRKENYWKDQVEKYGKKD